MAKTKQQNMVRIRKENIVVFPFMAQGHVIPFMALALKLEQERGYQITFVNTSHHITNLRRSLPPSSTIRLLEIPFDSPKHGLPPNVETAESLPMMHLRRLIDTTPHLKPAFKNIISSVVNEYDQGGHRLVCVISDMFFAGWAADVAHEFGVPHAIFNAGGGYGMAGWLLNLTSPNPILEPGPGVEIPQPQFEAKDLTTDENNMDGSGDEEDGWFVRNVYREWRKTDAMLFNTVEDMDSPGLTYFRKQFDNCSVWPIGPILSTAGSNARGGEKAEQVTRLCTKWLDSKPENSVLYVAFGSQSFPSEPQVKSLALALEASNRDFIWVLRPPYWLPEGFEERIDKGTKGLLLKEWAPQMHILSHASVGAFLSHCGWNSVLESLSNGVPILSWPMGAEQPYNSMMLQELGVAVCVAMGYESEVRVEEVTEKIKRVMGETEEGKKMKVKATEIKTMIEHGNTEVVNGLKGSSVTNMDEFLWSVTTSTKYSMKKHSLEKP